MLTLGWSDGNSFLGVDFALLSSARYNFLSFHQRQNIDQRSYGDLFRYCCQEMENLKFIDALQRIIALAMNAVRNTYELSEKIIQAMIDAVMGTAINFFKLDRVEFI